MATTIMNNGNANANFMNMEMELTPWDLSHLLICPIQNGILFYKPPEESQEFEKNFIDHLKDSLSRTLDFFPPLAGRLGTIKNEDNTMCFFVDCNNEGAECTHAIALGVSVSDVLDPIYVPEIVYGFFPQTGTSNREGTSKPLLGVQVTELVDGFFIGCSANHVIVDGTSFWHFFNSWSEISRGYDTISKSPVFERWLPGNVNRPVHIHPVGEHQNLLNDDVPTQLLERVFRFSKDNIAKLKFKANSEMGTTKSLLSNHFWLIYGDPSCVAAGRVIIIIPTIKEIYFFLPVGTRARIPLPETYFGNAAYGSKIIKNEDDLLHHGLGWAALKINEMVVQQTREQAIIFVEEWVKNPGIPSKCLNTSDPLFHTHISISCV